MKRMWSEKQIENIAKESAGGLPEIESGDAGKALVVNEAETGVEWAEVGAPDNVLVLPDEAPAAQQLVGVNTSNEQNALGIGDGLVVSDNTLGLNMLVLDFNHGTANVNISDTIRDNIKNFVYDFIKVINYSNSNHTYIFIPSHDTDFSSNTKVYQTMLTVYKDGSAPLRNLWVRPITLSLQGSAGAYQAAVWTANIISPYNGGSKNLSGASGTWGGESWNSFKGKYIYEISCYWRLTSADPYALIQWQTINGSGSSFYAVGKAEVYASDGTLSGTYKIVVDNAGNYTATSVQ